MVSWLSRLFITAVFQRYCLEKWICKLTRSPHWCQKWAMEHLEREIGALIDKAQRPVWPSISASSYYLMETAFSGDQHASQRGRSNTSAAAQAWGDIWTFRAAVKLPCLQYLAQIKLLALHNHKAYSHFEQVAQEEEPVLYEFIWPLSPEWLQQHVHLTATLSLTAALAEMEYERPF